MTAHKKPFMIAGLAALALLTPPGGGIVHARASVEDAAPPPSRDDLGSQIEALRKELAALRGAGAGDSARLAELERKIEVLAREIERLKVGEAAAEASAGAYGLGPAASKVYAVKRGVSIGGYGEMLYERFADRKDDDSPSGKRDRIDLVRVVLYAGYKFNDRVLFNSEIEIEHATTGEGAEEKGEVSAEFAYVDWLWRPEINFRAGLLLVPLGFINELHEPPTFLGARRPLTERLLLPTTWRENGLGVFGESGRSSYRAYLMAGLVSSGFAATGIRDGRQGGSESLAESLALAARYDFRPTLGSLIGAGLWIGDSSQGARGFDARTTVLDLHGELRQRGFDLRALYAQVTIDEAARVNAANGLEGSGSVGSTQRGGYLQAGYDVLSRTAGGERSLVPYLRWEKLDTQAEVPAGFRANPANDQRSLTIGIAWKPHPQVVVKGDYQDADNEAGTATDQLSVQLGYIF